MDYLTLGADPELVFIGPERGNEFPKLLLVTNYYEAQAGHRGRNPEIGADGHPYIVEVRPAPANDPRQLVRNIRDIFERHQNDVPDTTCWIAGSYVECDDDASWLPQGKPIGGHIHFGGIDSRDHFVSALDGLLSQLLVLLEDSRGAIKRKLSKYGKLSDIRVTNWGFEYRTPASWITSPSISLGVLALAKAIIFEEVEGYSQSILKQKGKILTTVSAVHKDKFVNHDKNYFLERLPVIWDVISRLQYWKTREGKKLWVYVCLLKHIGTTYPDWHNEKDILHRWGIRNHTPNSYIPRRSITKSVLPNAPVDAADAYNRIFQD